MEQSLRKLIACEKEMKFLNKKCGRQCNVTLMIDLTNKNKIIEDLMKIHKCNSFDLQLGSFPKNYQNK